MTIPSSKAYKQADEAAAFAHIKALAEKEPVDDEAASELWLDAEATVDAYIDAAAGEAAFVIADAHRAPGVAPARGSLLAPELGATLVLECQAVGEGPALRLTGPGIERCCELRGLGIDPHWWPARAGWCAPPQGVDLILCDARRIACIPRSIAVEV